VKRFAPEQVTITDVAQKAAVSKTTVSHVLSGNRPVAPATRARVEEAVRALGYRPNGLARGLRTRRTHLVALVIPDITNPFYPLVARGMEDGTGQGYRTFICNTDGRADREEEFLQEVTDRRADGVVLDSFHLGSDDVTGVVPRSVAVVQIGTTVNDDPGYDAVHADDEHGAYDAVRHLLDKGHKKIAMIQAPEGAGGKRNEGFARAMERAGLPPEARFIVSVDWTRAGGADAARRLLGLDDPPTAIFCANDLIALGVLDVARELDVRVPDQLAVVGFDDIDFAAAISPALTTVSNPAYETGLLAGILLRERMSGDYRGQPRTVTLPCRLVERATT
jgi:LacI family transcriptional regulator